MLICLCHSKIFKLHHTVTTVRTTFRFTVGSKTEEH